MKSYTFEFQDGDLCEGYFETDADAQAWVESILENRGYDVCDLVEGDWDADGKNDDGEQCYRMLYWATEEDAKDDPGLDAIGQLCKVGDA